jgi:hypothetical protein
VSDEELARIRQLKADAVDRARQEEERRKAEIALAWQRRLDEARQKSFLTSEEGLSKIVSGERFPYVKGLDLFSEAIAPLFKHSWARSWPIAEEFNQSFSEVEHLCPESKEFIDVDQENISEENYQSASLNFSYEAYIGLRALSGTATAAQLMFNLCQAQISHVPTWLEYREWLQKTKKFDLAQRALISLQKRIPKNELDQRNALRSFLIGSYWEFMKLGIVSSLLNELRSGWIGHPWLYFAFGVLGVYQSPLEVIQARGNGAVNLELIENVNVNIAELFPSSPELTQFSSWRLALSSTTNLNKAGEHGELMRTIVAKL